MKFSRSRSGFSFIEVLLVCVVVVILAIVVVYVLNPSQLLKQSRDGNRVASLTSLNKAISYYYSDAINTPSTLFLGTSSVMYISIPDPLATSTAGDQCQGISGLPTLGNGWVYHCVSSANLQKIDGTGWIPVNFNGASVGSLISNLPIDPTNSTSSGFWYAYAASGNTYELSAVIESQKYGFGGSSDVISNDGGISTSTYVKGTNLALINIGSTPAITFTTSSVIVGTLPYQLAFDSHTNTMWMAGANGNTVMQINDMTYATSTVTVQQGNSTLAFDSHTNTIWVGSFTGSPATQINDMTYVTSTVDAGPLPASLAFDSHTNTMWTINGNTYNVTQVNDTTYVTSTINTGISNGSLAFDSHTNTLWETANGSYAQINDTTYATTSFWGANGTMGIAFDSHTNTLWVANSGANTVWQINDTTYATSSFTVGTQPEYLAFDPHTNSIWVANYGTSTITQINDTTYATSTYAVGTAPQYVAFDSHTNAIWVTYGFNAIKIFTPSR